MRDDKSARVLVEAALLIHGGDWARAHAALHARLQRLTTQDASHRLVADAVELTEEHLSPNPPARL